MRRLRILVVLAVWAGFSGPVVLYAQYSSPAFDPNCYFPSLTDTSETQVRYGTKQGQLLGRGMMNIGPAPSEEQSRLFFSGLPQSPVFMAAVRTEQNFDINNPDVQGTSTFLPPPLMGDGWFTIYRGHFHTKDLWDLLTSDSQLPGVNDYRIYWSDDNGLYDSSRYTELLTSYYTDSIPIIPMYFNTDPYCAYLTSDTVEDIVIGGFPHVFLYKGGEDLFDRAKPDNFFGPIVNEDSSFILDTSYKPGTKISIQGDFRGTGRDDLVLITDTDLMFFPNDPPFSMEKLRTALLHDTLAAFWQSKGNYKGIWGFAEPALPHPAWDKSKDLLLVGDEVGIFKGGPDFGSKRLNLDTVDYLFHVPGYYDSRFGLTYGVLAIDDMGDMTGTGTHVLYIPMAVPQTVSLHFFYVTGPTFDDKVDMFLETNSGAYGDSLTANGDNLEDVALGFPYADDTENASHTEEGEVAIIYGSKKIPAPMNSVAAAPPATTDQLTLNPNPVFDHTTVTWQPFEEGMVTVRLLDILGRTVFEERRPSSGSYEQFRISFPRLAPGAYYLELEESGNIRRAKVIIEH